MVSIKREVIKGVMSDNGMDYKLLESGTDVSD